MRLSFNESVWNKRIMELVTMSGQDDICYYPYLSQNRSLPFDFVTVHPDNPWDWSWLSGNRNITMSDVLAHPDKPWNWNCLSISPSITMADVFANPDKPWNWKFQDVHGV
jgi:hypothetical protein